MVEPRRAGTALFGFGLVGVILATVLAVGMIVGGIAARNLDERIATDQARVVQLLDRITRTMERLTTSTANAGATLESSSAALGRARDVVDQLTAVTVELADALEVSILGTRPFTTVAQQFRDLGAQTLVFRDDLHSLVGRLDTNAGDVTEIAVELQGIEDEVRLLTSRVDESQQLREVVGLMAVGMLLGGLLIAWLGVAAAACAWFGWRLRGSASSDG